MSNIDLSEQELATVMAYLDVATTKSGRLVLDDLRASFFDGDHPGIAEELAEIPHPYRPYVEQGMRMAYKKMIGVVALAEQIKAGIVVINPAEENTE